MMRVCFIIAAACSFAINQTATAQSVPSALHVVVEGIDQNGQACGLTVEAEKAAAQSAMRYNRVTEGNLLATTLYVNTLSLHIGSSLCVTDVSVEIYDYQPSQLGGVGPTYAEHVYCDEGTLLSGPDHEERVMATIKILFDKCLSDIGRKRADYRTLEKVTSDANSK